MKKAIVMAIGLYLTGITSAFAAGQATSLNLGTTSFLDGFGDPTVSGFIYENYLRYSRSGEITGPNGGNSGLPVDSINVLLDLNQFIYTAPVSFLGFQPGFDVLVPVVNLDASYTVSGPFPQTTGTGFGDVVFGPILQGAPVIRDGRPVFSQRFEFDVIAPTGEFRRDKGINAGSGFWSLNPYWAVTVSPLPNLTFSSRLHYLYNFETSDVSALFPGADRFQAGQAIHDNFAAAYKVAPQVRIGLNGYYFKQITDNKINGKDVPNSREETLALGPGALFGLGKQDLLFANIYFELHTENRPKGDTVQLRYVHFFGPK